MNGIITIPPEPIFATILDRVQCTIRRILQNGSSYRAFVYVGNGGFCFAADCKHNNRKDKCRFFFDFQVIERNSRSGHKLTDLNRLNSLIDTNVIATVNKKTVNRTVSFDK